MCSEVACTACAGPGKSPLRKRNAGTRISAGGHLACRQSLINLAPHSTRVQSTTSDTSLNPMTVSESSTAPHRTALDSIGRLLRWRCSWHNSLIRLGRGPHGAGQRSRGHARHPDRGSVASSAATETVSERGYLPSSTFRLPSAPDSSSPLLFHESLPLAFSSTPARPGDVETNRDDTASTGDECRGLDRVAVDCLPRSTTGLRAAVLLPRRQCRCVLAREATPSHA